MPPEVDHTHSAASDFPQKSDGTQFARNGDFARGCVPRGGSSECDRILRAHYPPSSDGPTFAKMLLGLQRCFRDLCFQPVAQGLDRARINACHARSVKCSTAGGSLPGGRLADGIDADVRPAAVHVHSGPHEACGDLTTVGLPSGRSECHREWRKHPNRDRRVGTPGLLRPSRDSCRGTVRASAGTPY